MAIDITTMRLPEALWPHFGSHGACRGQGPAQSPIAVLYDLFFRIPIAFRMGRVNIGERSLAKRLLAHLKTGSLLVFDNGLYSIEIFATLAKRRIHFLTPMRSNSKPRLVKRVGCDDGIYEICKSTSYKYRDKVPQTMQVRVITVHRKGFRPRRLLNSLLDSAQYPAPDIADLYHERWHIETFFREFKHTLKARHFHARKKHALYVEMVFQMLLCTLSRLAMADGAMRSGQGPGEISFTKCISEMRNILEMTAVLPLEQWPHLYEQLIERLARSRIDKRPGRIFERDRQKRRRKSRSRWLAQIKNQKRNTP